MPAWADYEQRVFELFKNYYRNANVRKNVMVRGRFSKRKRQIDILVTETTPAGKLKTVIDAKFFGRKVNVKAVDGLAGFVDDVGAEKGMLITNIGYSKAALKRAYYGPHDLELDILDFSALQQLQSFVALPYVGKRTFIVRAPLGWIVDSTRTEDRLCNMYQRGLNVTRAVRNKEFIYINFWDRKRDPVTASQLDKAQTRGMRDYDVVRVTHRETVSRNDAVSRLRIARAKKWNHVEVTGFLEFKDVIFYAVLITPVEKQRSNIRRLESVLQLAIPAQLKTDNTKLIKHIKERIEQSPPPEEKSRLLAEMGHWYRDMDQLADARRCLEESLSLVPGDYSASKELLAVVIGLHDKEATTQLMMRILRLDPHNPTVFNDCLSYGRGFVTATEMVNLFDELKTEQSQDQLVQANSDFYCGQLLLGADPQSSKQRLLSARRLFRQVLPAKHQVFTALKMCLQQLGSKETRAKQRH